VCWTAGRIGVMVRAGFPGYGWVFVGEGTGPNASSRWAGEVGGEKQIQDVGGGPRS